MASEVKTNKISPSTGTDVTLGDASDTFTLPSGSAITVASGGDINVASGGEIDIASGATLDVNGIIDVTGATTTGFPAGGMAGVQAYTSGGTWTKATRESALGITITKVIVEVQGAGGSGSASTNYGGGAAGGFAKKLVDVSSVTASPITVGAGGAGLAAGGGAGNAGGLSSWADSVNTDVVGNGGAGKPNSTAGATGGTGTGGDINITGGSSINAQVNPGGANMYGAGSSQRQDGQGYGSGGGNGYTSYVSGAGQSGIVIVWEYQ
jgi:hypothetical protein